MEPTRIMVVDDERPVAREVRRCLENWGYSVCAVADSGDLALELVRTHRPDLVLMDIVLKGSKDGIEAAADIRSEHDVPIVFLTAQASRFLIERAKQVEPYGYLLKPFVERELRATIELALFKSQRDRERFGTPDAMLITCVHCRRIKNESGHWESFEAYLWRHYRTALSHGLCPKCSKERYPDVF